MNIQQLAESRYQHTDHNPICNLHANDICNLERTAFTSGVELGMQFAEWASGNRWEYDNTDKVWYRYNTVDSQTTSELFAIFIKSIEHGK
jgi:hypothetical protein